MKGYTKPLYNICNLAEFRDITMRYNMEIEHQIELKFLIEVQQKYCLVAQS